MEDETVRYSIIFPPISADGTYEEETFSVVESANINTKRPVVILLGWAGCLDKHLAKYSEIYERKRYITIRYTAPTDAIFFNTSRLKGIAEKVLDIVFQYELEEHPLFFHIFSNGGCFVYAHAAEAIHTSKKYSALKVNGCIIDSAPGKRRILNAVRAFMSTLRIHVVFRYLLSFCLFVYLIISRIVVFMFAQKTGMGSAFFLFETIRDDPGRWPQLFLYSKADTIILSQDIEEVVQHRKEQGVTVSTECWEDSPHVAHFRMYREAYAQKCLDFVTNCLTQNRQPCASEETESQ